MHRYLKSPSAINRKAFLKSLLAGAVSAPALLAACGKDDVTPSTSTTTGTAMDGSSSNTSR